MHSSNSDAFCLLRLPPAIWRTKENLSLAAGAREARGAEYAGDRGGQIGLDARSTRRPRARESIATHGGVDPAAFEKLSGLLRYVDGDYKDLATFQSLRKELGYAAQHPTHYLAIPPAVFGEVVEQLGKSSCAAGAHLIIEKPFGRDLDSARELNKNPAPSVRRIVDLSDRPFSRQTAGAEPALFPVRQLAA